MQVPAPDIIAQLQKEILSLGGIKSPGREQSRWGGLSFMQKHFPHHCFPLAAIHEFDCALPEVHAASAGFIAGMIHSCLPAAAAMVWISRQAAIFPAALAAFHIEPQQVIFIHPPSDKEMLWVLEEALKCDRLSAVVAETRGFNFTQSRRFQLAVEQSRVTGFLLNQNPLTQNACFSKWRIRSIASNRADGLPGVGHPRWEVLLQKVRNGKPGAWQVEWNGSDFSEIVSTGAWYPEILQQQTG